MPTELSWRVIEGKEAVQKLSMLLNRVNAKERMLSDSLGKNANVME